MNFHPEYKEQHTKAKRRKTKTECSVIRRDHYRGCGICGSENLAEQGVKYCRVCGSEKDYLTVQGGWFFNSGVALSCKCVKEFKTPKGQLIKRRDTAIEGVKKCLDCGAVQSNYCPNCKSKRGWGSSKCWNNGFGNLFCQECGFKNYLG